MTRCEIDDETAKYLDEINNTCHILGKGYLPTVRFLLNFYVLNKDVRKVIQEEGARIQETLLNQQRDYVLPNTVKATVLSFLTPGLEIKDPLTEQHRKEHLEKRYQRGG